MGIHAQGPYVPAYIAASKKQMAHRFVQAGCEPVLGTLCAVMSRYGSLTGAGAGNHACQYTIRQFMDAMIESI